MDPFLRKENAAAAFLGLAWMLTAASGAFAQRFGPVPKYSYENVKDVDAEAADGNWTVAR